jgi:hypothetical protein
LCCGFSAFGALKCAVARDRALQRAAGALWFYARDAHSRGRTFPVAVAEGTRHCGAGCMLGDIVAAFGLFFRNQVIKLSSIPGVARLTFGRDIIDALKLPGYQWPAQARGITLP